jgi:uncharacterized protein
VVKPGQIVKVKVMEIDVKRQRISLTMRLDDASGASSRSDRAHAGSQAGAARDPSTRLQPSPPQASQRESQPIGTIAMALARAKMKK